MPLIQRKRDLMNLSQTCKALHSLAQPFIYKELDVPRNFKRSDILYSAILQRPVLAKYVLSLQFHPLSKNGKVSAKANEVLPMFVNLQTLIFPSCQLTPNTDMLNFMEQLRDRGFVQQSEHTCIAGTPSFLIDLIMRNARVYTEDTHNLNSCFPQLDSFTGEPMAAVALVPGRPVSSLSLGSSCTKYLDSYENIFQALSHSQVPIRNLCINSPRWEDPMKLNHDPSMFVKSITLNFPGLRELHICSMLYSRTWKTIIRDVSRKAS
jgi:hypothetical protein